jgi:HAD superfamily hydrolase (TIGR01459 family)
MIVAAGLGALAARFDAAFCDIWGVVHNGRAAFPKASDALSRFRESGRIVILVSNAPRPSESIVPQLDRLGVPRSAWDGIVTSGDVTRGLVAEASAKPLFHLGPERDRGLFSGFDIRFAPAEAAETVICTGLFDDTVETPEDYRDLLQGLRARAVPMICANPDLVVDRGGHMIYCAGALADAYEKMGGAVTFCGKPHPPIYAAALSVVEDLLGRPVDIHRVLAIGDSVRTDLAGAAALGCGALFIARGIHAQEAGHSEGAWDEATARAFFEEQGVSPDAAMAELEW